MLENGDWVNKKFGKLMIENHELLNQVGVGLQELDELVDIAMKNGALGAKLTGAGGGGCMIALCPTIKTQETIKKSMEDSGFHCYLTTIGNI